MMQTNLMKNDLFNEQFGRKSMPNKIENLAMLAKRETNTIKLPIANFNFQKVSGQSSDPQRQLYNDDSVLCKSNNQKLDEWLHKNTQWEILYNESESNSNLVQLFGRYIGNLSKEQKSILKLESKKQSKNIDREVENIYIKQATSNSLKILLQQSDLWSRNYQVYIGQTTQKVSGVVFNIKLQQLSQLFFNAKEKINSRSLLRQIIHQGTELKWELKFIKIQGVTFEDVSEIVTQIAILKSANIIGRQFLIYKQFGYDFILFNNYVCFAQIQVLQSKNQNLKKQKMVNKPEQQLPSQIKQEIKQKAFEFKTILKLKNMLNRNLYEEISDFLDKFKLRQFRIELENILSSFVAETFSLKKEGPRSEMMAVILRQIANVSQKKPKIKGISQIFSFRNRKQEYIGLVQSLNVIQLERQKYVDQFFEMLRQGQFCFRYGFLERLTGSVMVPQRGEYSKEKGRKQGKRNCTVLLKVREMMIYLSKYFKARKATKQLQYILSYFSAIGDQSSAMQLQAFLLSLFEKVPDLCILKMLEYFLGKKIVTVSFDNYLYNHYIKKLSLLKLDGQDLERQRILVLTIMCQIKQCVEKRQYQSLRRSPSFKQFSQFVRSQKNFERYGDVLLLLRQIYENNYLELSKDKTKQFTAGLICTNMDKVRSPYLRMMLLKDYFYDVLYMHGDKRPEKLKEVLLQLPAACRYGSLYWCSVCQAAGLSENVEGILNGSYLQLLKERPNDESYSSDLVSMLQIFVRLPKNSRELQKLKFQLLILGLSKYLANVCRLSEEPKDRWVPQLRSFSQLMYIITRQDISQLDKMREKLCCAKVEGHLQSYQYLTGTAYRVKQSQEQLYYHVGVLQMTVLLSRNKGKQSIPILTKLMKSYPYKASLYFYYLKIKYSMSFKQKQVLHKIIMANIKHLFKQADPTTQPTQKAIRLILSPTIITTCIIQIFNYDSLLTGFDILLAISSLVAKWYHIYGTRKIRQSLFEVFQDYLHGRKEKNVDRFHQVYDHLISLFRVKPDDDIVNGEGKNRALDCTRVLRQNPFLCYPLLIVMEYQHFPHLTQKQHCELIDTIVHLIMFYGFKPHVPMLAQWQTRICEEAEKVIRAKISSCPHQKQTKRYQSKLLLLEKRYQELLMGKQAEELKEKGDQIPKEGLLEGSALSSALILEKKPKHFEKSAKKLQSKFNKRNNNRKAVEGE